MKKSMKRIAAILVAFAVAFTMMPAATGDINAHAASYWKKATAAAENQTTVNISWTALTKKQRKKIHGIAVFRNGEQIKLLSKTAKTYRDSMLQAGTAYTYQLKTYKKYTKKTKLWYNKQTGEYQKKKPAKKYRGKRKTFKTVTYKYYNASAPMKVVTQAASGTTPAPTPAPSPTPDPAPTPEPAKPVTYTITWKNWDGSVLQTGSVEKGTTPKYTGSTPQRAADSSNTYSFTGWSPSVAAASANATYTAQFKATAKPAPTPTVKNVQITDYLGTVRTVSTDSAEYKNPLYNRDVDGEFTVKSRKYIQKSGVTFKTDYSTNGYTLWAYNGDARNVSFSISRKEYKYTKWGNELDNPSSETAYYILGNNGRRLAAVAYSLNEKAANVHFTDFYYDIGDVTITAKYNGAVIDSYTVTINGIGDTGSDGFSKNLRNAYNIAKEAVSFFKNGGSLDENYSQAWYKDLINRYGTYYADMKAIEAYVEWKYEYENLDCWAGYAILDAYSVVDYGEYGDWCNPIPENTGHVAFRPYSYCEAGSFNDKPYSGKGSYFQTAGHH